ncbi:galectin-9-like [Ictalurus furcatus]|uniref:galectin-9-like n=1 Tax=Ictalurus furcatus TaxID=66913 RepID=UPI0023501B23|nr:galectin-9-like [Ictalurus furcatus]
MVNQHPYLNPKLPFTGCIQGGLFEGKTVTVTGRVLAGAERFCVNLLCVTNTSSDIVLHFNPRYRGNSGHVVCNTLQSSCWGSEQRSKHTPFPRGSDFTLTFLVNRDSYSVIVNGAHFMEYLHQLPVSRVNAIFVDGGVEVTSITFQNPAVIIDRGRPMQPEKQRYRSKLTRGSGWNMQGHQQHASQMQAPAACDVADLSAAPPPYSSQPAYVIPYKTIIQGGFYPCRGITVQGCVNHNADRFNINLRYTSGIALHFNPRFNENVVVRNSLVKERWGREERSGGMPFYRGQQFTVSITCDTQCYRIAVNGTQMFTYNHRHFLFQQIDILEVDGNISVSSVVV